MKNRFPVIALKKDAERRFRAGQDSGHPWVYSNEIQTPFPAKCDGGELVELRDSHGNVIAYGYFNTHSLIAFRTLIRADVPRTPHSSRSSSSKDSAPKEVTSHVSKDLIQPGETEESLVFGLLVGRLRKAWKMREVLGHSGTSFRWVFAEADDLPGLIVDRYLFENQKSQAIVFQLNTAGVDRWASWQGGQFYLKVIETVWEKISADLVAAGQHNSRRIDFKNTTVILRQDSGARAREGLKEIDVSQTVLQLGQVSSVAALSDVWIDVDQAAFTVDLIGGQKTGFFLDQRESVRWLCQVLTNQPQAGAKDFSVLDLCPYVGQWSVQIAKALKGRVSATLLDVSEDALERAAENLKRVEARKVEIIKGDALSLDESLGEKVPEQLSEKIKNKSFDIVVADPPAFIKSRKDLGPGKAAYASLFGQAISKVKSGGFIVASSCSGLLTEEDFSDALFKGQAKADRTVRWFYRGGHATDHPILAQFPEGKYLKTWIGLVN